MLQPHLVLTLWEEINQHQLSDPRATDFLGHRHVADLSRFSYDAVKTAGEAVHSRDGRLLLVAWLEQVRHDVYDRRGTRSGQASPGFLADAAQAQKASPTKAEEMLWQQLRLGIRGLRFASQVPMKGFILDFYCPAARVAVEVDGSSHRLSYASDGRRDEYLRAERISTLRVTNSQIVNGLTAVLQTITDAVDTPAAHECQAQRDDRSAEAVKSRMRTSATQPPTSPSRVAGSRRPTRPPKEATPVQYAKRAFSCPRCDRSFVAPIQPPPRCRKHPHEKLVRLCANRDQRPATVGDHCRECAEAREVARGLGTGPDPYGQRHHRGRKLM